MKLLSKVLLVVSFTALVFGITVGLMAATYHNTEVSLRNQISAQQKSAELTFDSTWKIISQQAMVADKYKNDFKAIYADIMDNRYANGGGELMKWISEHNPQFDSSLYSKLMSSIEANRKAFEAEQKQLVDLKREHDTLLVKFPSSLFIGGRESIDISLVTSSKTKETFASGEENDIDLFDKE